MNNNLLLIAETYFKGQDYQHLDLLKYNDESLKISNKDNYSEFEKQLIISSQLDIIPPGKFMVINSNDDIIHKMGTKRNFNLFLIDIQVRILEPSFNKLNEMVKTCEFFYQNFFDVSVKIKNKHHFQLVDCKNQFILGDFEIKHYPKIGWLIIGNAISEPKFSKIKNVQ